MSDIVAARKAPAARPVNVALWMLQAVLALQFAGGGLAKLAGPPAASGCWSRGCRAWPRSGWPP